MLAKKQIKVFGEVHYLLGIRKEDNKQVWFEDFSWDCGWYWGGGYLHTFTNEKNPTASKDIGEHTHFDSTFFDADKNSWDTFQEYFSDTVLTEKEQWILLDLMQSFYTFKKVAEIYKQGNSHYTSDGTLNLKDPNQYEAINQAILGKRLIPAVRDLLEP